MTIDPTIGIIYRRDAHPALRSVSDFQDENLVSLALCDEHMPLSEALEREWPVDAHMAMYVPHASEEEMAYVRVTKRSPFVAELIGQGGFIRVPVLVFDHDLPKLPSEVKGAGQPSKGEKQVWSEAGLAEFVQGLGQASSLPPPTYWYSTLHGSRFVYVLTEPVNHLRAEAICQGIIKAFAAVGIELDGACKDWTRLFRLPKTVREDSGKQFHDDPTFMLLGPGETVDPDALPTLAEGEADTFAATASYDEEQPDADQVRELLSETKNNGQVYASKWAKVAKKYLQGRDAYGPCFEHEPIDVTEGWNNGVIKLAGQIIGMTARQEEASAEGVFALIYAGLEQLQADEDQGSAQTDWFAKAWDIVCRMWSNEISQITAENQEREANAAEGSEVREQLLENLREGKGEDVPEDEDEAREWFKQRMVASTGRQHHVMRRDGSYNVRPVSDSMLVPMIRELSMGDVIETYEMRGKSWVPKSSQNILNEHATPIIGVRCSARSELAYIDGDPGYRTLHIPVHRLNNKVIPRWSDEADEWLAHLLGEKYDLGVDWLAHSLDVAAPICALNLFGASGTGKGMLVQALAECFEGERLNDGRALGKWNAGLLDSPIINCDEGVPNIKSDESLPLDQAFRTMVSGGNLTVRSMHTNPYNADIYPRIIFTGNDPDIMRSIVGHRDLTDEDVRAIELRLLNIEVMASARVHLTAHGNYSHTQGWVHGRHASRYVLASHIMWLFENRKPSQNTSGRLLVEGEVDTTLVRSMRLRSDKAQAVLRALVAMLQSPNALAGMHIVNGRMWVTPSGVVNYIDRPTNGIQDILSLPRAGQVLRQFSSDAPPDGKVTKMTPPGAKRGRWFEIDLGVLFEESLRHGLEASRIETLLHDQVGGELKIAIANAHVDPEKR